MIKPQTQLRHRPPLLLPYSSSFSSSFSSSRPGSLALCSLPLPAKLPSHHSFIHIDWCFRECHFLSSPTHHSTLRQRYVRSLALPSSSSFLFFFLLSCNTYPTARANQPTHGCLQTPPTNVFGGFSSTSSVLLHVPCFCFPIKSPLSYSFLFFCFLCVSWVFVVFFPSRFVERSHKPSFSKNHNRNSRSPVTSSCFLPAHASFLRPNNYNSSRRKHAASHHPFLLSFLLPFWTQTKFP